MTTKADGPRADRWGAAWPRGSRHRRRRSAPDPDRARLASGSARRPPPRTAVCCDRSSSGSSCGCWSSWPRSPAACTPRPPKWPRRCRSDSGSVFVQASRNTGLAALIGETPAVGRGALARGRGAKRRNAARFSQPPMSRFGAIMRRRSFRRCSRCLARVQSRAREGRAKSAIWKIRDGGFRAGAGPCQVTVDRNRCWKIREPLSQRTGRGVGVRAYGAMLMFP